MVSGSCVCPFHIVEGIWAQARAFLSRTTTMRVGSFRFTPPPLELSPEMRWLLLRSFGPAGQAFEGAFDPQAALRLARTYSLASRVCARAPVGRLADELGEAIAGEFLGTYHRAAANDLLYEFLAGEVACTAQEIRAPAILLKHASLRFGGIVALGARGIAADLDVLVPMEQQPPLWRALLARGFRGTGPSRQDHHFPALIHPTGAVLELHTEIPGLRLNRRPGLGTANELIGRGLCRRAPGLPEGCYLLTREVMLAHVLVHGIAQHGFSPETYPLMRMVGDLLDLNFGTAALEEFLAEPYQWISKFVSVAEVYAAAELCDCLVTGRLPPVSKAPGHARTRQLLAHIIAGPVDLQYRQVLRVKGAGTLLGLGGKSVIGTATPLFHALFLTREQVDLIYGRPSGWLGYLGWRLWRPFDLVARFLRYGRVYWTLKRSNGPLQLGEMRRRVGGHQAQSEAARRPGADVETREP